MGRIEDKISEINRYLRELESILPPGFEEYQSNLEKKAACERYVEKIVEAATDLAFLVIKNRKLRMPDDDLDAFNVLLEGKIIDDGLAARLKNAKGMRNIISHQYGNIDDEIVFEAIDKELSRDIKEFVKKAGR
ncbi:DUF86 domain-containing protein [Candidatus Woesearchaeota archaeon]|nr:DUF86 domain-containing protein [Candidatus Woesearchaeota archaeon]MBI2661771.1 DUF86 domain-containing protein [Candidatus Woesearchaeota archaeon]